MDGRPLRDIKARMRLRQSDQVDDIENEHCHNSQGLTRMAYQWLMTPTAYKETTSIPVRFYAEAE